MIINVKLFGNGAIQMTGCKNIEDSFKILEMIFKILSNVKAIVLNKEIVEVLFIVDEFGNDMSTKLSAIQIYNYKIVMINSYFNIDFLIDRNKLFNVMREKNINCNYDPQRHSAVNCKYLDNNKQITILIFEKGSIIINGVNNYKQITVAYNFINKFLLQNYQNIVRNI